MTGYRRVQRSTCTAGVCARRRIGGRPWVVLAGGIIGCRRPDTSADPDARSRQRPRLLRAPALVDHQGAIRVSPQQPIRLPSHMIQYRPLRLCQFAQHVVHGLMVCFGNRLFHPFHVFGFRLEQATDIVLSHRLDRPGSPAEVTAETVAKVQKPLTDPGQQPHPPRQQPSFLTLPTTPLSCATSSSLVFCLTYYLIYDLNQ